MEETKTMEAPQAAAIGAEQVKKLTAVLQKYKTGKKRTEQRIVASENWWKLRNDAEESGDSLTMAKEGFKSASGWLSPCRRSRRFRRSTTRPAIFSSSCPTPADTSTTCSTRAGARANGSKAAATRSAPRSLRSRSVRRARRPWFRGFGSFEEKYIVCVKKSRSDRLRQFTFVYLKFRKF